MHTTVQNSAIDLFAKDLPKGTEIHTLVQSGFHTAMILLVEQDRDADDLGDHYRVVHNGGTQATSQFTLDTRKFRYCSEAEAVLSNLMDGWTLTPLEIKARRQVKKAMDLAVSKDKVAFGGGRPLTFTCLDPSHFEVGVHPTTLIDFEASDYANSTLDDVAQTAQIAELMDEMYMIGATQYGPNLILEAA